MSEPIRTRHRLPFTRSVKGVANGAGGLSSSRRTLDHRGWGGSNGSRRRLGNGELQRLVNERHLEITGGHFPPGTSQWKKIEPRLCSPIPKNWRGRPWTSHEVIVNLIANTTTQAGLKIDAALDSRTYPTSMKVADQEMEDLNVKKDDFHGEWN